MYWWVRDVEGRGSVGEGWKKGRGRVGRKRKEEGGRGRGKELEKRWRGGEEIEGIGRDGGEGER